MVRKTDRFGAPIKKAEVENSFRFFLHTGIVQRKPGARITGFRLRVLLKYRVESVELG
jgi:hypothetical protein